MSVAVATEIFNAAIKAVQPGTLLPQFLYVQDGMLHLGNTTRNIADPGRLIVIAAGKAAGAMALAAELQAGELFSSAICITKYGHSVPLQYFQTIEAAHPVPDENSILAGEFVLKTLQQLNEADTVLLLLSGGASSLLADVPEGCSLEEIQQLFGMLVNSGAGIHEINIVRKHMSRIKGGGFAREAYPARVITMIISDVPGDDLSTIASGPTVPDPSTFRDAYVVLVKYNIWQQTTQAIRDHIQKGLEGDVTETVKPGEHFLQHSSVFILANIKTALDAARKKAKELGYHSIIINDLLTGNTEEAAISFIQSMNNYSGQLPACLLMGGETTLKVTGNGKGGRNQHFVLTALDALIKQNLLGINHHFTVLSAGTDGTDGPTDAAGAVFSSRNITPELKCQLLSYISRFDSYHFFHQYGGLLETGPTQTNVMDLIVGLIHSE